MIPSYISFILKFYLLCFLEFRMNTLKSNSSGALESSYWLHLANLKDQEFDTAARLLALHVCWDLIHIISIGISTGRLEHS
jgi:hypothetical protein